MIEKHVFPDRTITIKQIGNKRIAISNRPATRPEQDPMDDRIIENGRYRARRNKNSNFVYGFLIKDKDGKILGILNENTPYYFNGRFSYAELAFIDTSTLEKWHEDAPAEYYLPENLIYERNES